MDPGHTGTLVDDAANGRGLTISNNAKSSTSLAFLGGAFSKVDVEANCSFFTSSTDLKYCNKLEQYEF